MAETPLGLTYPESGDHTRLWEHIQSLAEDVDALIGAIGAFSETSTGNGRRDINSGGSLTEVTPSFSHQFTNPINRPVAVRCTLQGLLYTEANSGTTYIRVRPDAAAGVTVQQEYEYRWEVPEGESNTNFGGILIYSHAIVDPGVTATFRVWGRKTQSAPSYFNYSSLDTRVVGIQS